MFARNPRPQGPTKIGKYNIEQTIGQGGFGQVYRAYDASVGRSVAIKVLKASADPSDLMRFRNEASAAGNLHHKNIVTVHEFGEQDGLAYLVMEFVEGQDLQHIIQNRSAGSILSKMQIMSQVAEGLYCAHTHGVVHRDVKPANIMVLADGTVKIMDFGIARLLHVDHATLTQAGFLVGSVPYMSPEQFRDEPIDALCDIWAYGIIYYELITGAHPFGAPDATTIMYRITATDPAPVRDLAPDCPRELADVIARAMAKDRDLRYQSMEDLRLDTEPIVLAMQKQHAEELVREAQVHAEKNAWDLVQSKVRQVLELDATNTVARQLREMVRQRSQRQAVRPKIEALVKRGEESLSQRRFHEAIESFESALRLDTTDTTIRARLLAAHSRYEQSKQAVELINTAWRELKTSNLTGAFEKLAEALRLDPENTEAQRAMAAVQEQARQRQIEREVAQEVEKAKGLALIQCFDDALAVLTAARGKYGAVAAVEESLQDTLARKAQQEKVRQLAGFIEAAKDLLKRDQFESAVMRLRAALIDFPEESELSRLLAYAERQLENQRQVEALERVRTEAERLMSAGEFDAALQGIEIALRAHPGDALLVEMLQTAVRGKAAQRREAAITAAVRRGQELAQNSRHAEALELLSETEGEYPDDERIGGLSKRLREELGRMERADAVRRIIGQALQLSREGDMDRAIALLESSQARYPEAKELGEAVAVARRTKAAQDEQRAVAAALANAAARENEQQWNAALNIIETGLLAYPGSEELKNRAAQLREHIAAEELKRAVAREGRDIEGLIASRKFDEAARRLKAARGAYPSDPALEELAVRARSAMRAAREQCIERVRGWLRAGKPDQAQQVLNEGLEALPGDAALAALNGEIESERQCRAKLAAALAQLAKQDFDGAQRSLEEALKITPGHPAVTDSLNEVALRRREFERARRVEEGRRKARELAQGKRFDEARRELAALVKQYPQASELWSEIADIEKLQQQHAEKEQREEELTALFQMKDLGTPEQVLSGATQILEVAPSEARAHELASWAKEQIERERAERERAARDRAEQAAREAAERARAEQAGRQKAEQERAEQAARAKAELVERAEQAAREKAERERAARRARTKADLERAEQLAREKAAREREAQPAAASSSPGPAAAARPAVLPKAKAVPASRRTYVIAAEVAVIVLLGAAIWMRSRPKETAQLDLDVATITATSAAGERGPIHRTIRVQGGPMRVRINTDAAWIRVSPPEARTPLSLNIDLDPAQLRAGEYSGSIRIDAGDVLRVIPVSLTVPPPAVAEGPRPAAKPAAPVTAGNIAVSPGSVAFEYQASSTPPEPERVQISSPRAGSAFTASVSKGGEWLSVTPESGTTPRQIAIQVKRNSLSAGEYDGTVAVRSENADSGPQLIHVNLRIAPAPAVAAAAPVKPAPVTVTPPAQTTVQAPAVPVAPSPKPAGPPLRYGGAPRGTITWTGLLAPGARLEFTADAVNTGSMRGHLPGVEVDLDVNPSDSLKIETRPAAANEYGRLVVVNAGAAPVSSIEIRWRTK